jgi:hypothetical protein
MKSGAAKYLELIDRRSEFLRALIRVEQEWRRAFIALNLHDSERLSADGELFCERIRSLDKEIALFQAKAHEAGTNNTFVADPAIDDRIRAAQRQIAALHLDLKESNAINRAILKRSKFTISALRNLFNSHAPTYASPAAASVGTIYEERV